MWKERDRLKSRWRARQRRARGALHQIDLNTTTPAASSVSFPFVTPPNFGNQNKSPQQLALSSQSHRNMTLQECYSYLNVGTLPPCSLFQNDHTKNANDLFFQKFTTIQKENLIQNQCFTALSASNALSIRTPF